MGCARRKREREERARERERGLHGPLGAHLALFFEGEREREREGNKKITKNMP